MTTRDTKYTELHEQQFTWLREVAACLTHVRECRANKKDPDKVVEAKLNAATTNLIRSCRQFNAKLAAKFVVRYGLSESAKDQLAAAGDEGAWHASMTFDFNEGTTFLTWARWWMRAAMQTWLREHARSRRLPNALIGMPNRVREILEGADASTFEGAALIARYSMSSDMSLDLPVYADRDGPALGDTIPDENASPLEQVSAAQRAAALHYAIAQISKPKVQAVLRARLDGRTLEEAALAVGVKTRERARQLQEEGYEQVRRILLRSKIDLG